MTRDRTPVGEARAARAVCGVARSRATEEAGDGRHRAPTLGSRQGDPISKRRGARQQAQPAPLHDQNGRWDHDPFISAGPHKTV